MERVRVEWMRVTGFEATESHESLFYRTSNAADDGTT
jgi:hypothetical protein